MSGYAYDSGFFDFVDASSGRSASAFLEAVGGEISPQSVLDVGCGRGVWLAAWAGRGVSDLLGVDGDYVDRNHLKIAPAQFRAHDLTGTLALDRQFDLVQCLEVAEHIEAAHADRLIDNLVKHGDVILFSAAIPGQGGEFHVNEQPVSYWAEKFRARGYLPFDYPRQQVRDITVIEPWYRYNVLLYVRASAVSRLSEVVRRTEIRSGEAIPDYSPSLWRLRCWLLSLLPRCAIHQLARLKHFLSTFSKPQTGKS